MELFSLSTLFIEEPYSWGLRGDPFLWKEMRLQIDFSEYPETVEDFEKVLTDLFFNLTGEEVGKNKQIFVERYSEGGMSSGFVSSNLWTDDAFKILKERFSKLQNEYNDKC